MSAVLVVALGIAAVMAGPATDAKAVRYCDPHPGPATLSVDRISGSDRYATAVAISKASFAPGVCTVYIASGETFPDALAGAAQAAEYAAPNPVLLVRHNSIPASVKAELQRLDPLDIVVLGGPGAVSSQVASQLWSYADGILMRLSGSDRYATAAEIFYGRPSPTGTIYLASGEDFPDALAGAPLAGRRSSPLLLVRPDSIPVPVRQHLKQSETKRIVILGGTGAVSDRLAAELRSYASEAVVRLAGADRYATAVEISKALGSGTGTVYVASGANFPDALAAAPAASLSSAPILLIEPDSIPSVVDEELKRLRPRHIIVLGGTGAVSDEVALQLEAYLVP